LAYIAKLIGFSAFSAKSVIHLISLTACFYSYAIRKMEWITNLALEGMKSYAESAAVIYSSLWFSDFGAFRKNTHRKLENRGLYAVKYGVHISKSEIPRLPQVWIRHSSEIAPRFSPWTVLFFSRPRSEGWPHHGRTFSICPCTLSFWLTLPRRVLSTSWCCPSRPCVAFLACVHLSLFLALSLSLNESYRNTSEVSKLDIPFRTICWT